MGGLSGDFSERLTFETPVATADGYGGETVEWRAVQPRAFAKVEAVRGSESDHQGAVRATRTYLFTLHRRGDITESMRIRWGDEILNIRELRRGPARALTMIIVAEAGVTQ
ncbi:phage head closure protein [Rhodomicrobium lacus]|uniref:phage head closure protein n=1 Tax=Rhodomicrobium lacus TaxID=2498452 RepID=UPI000F8DD18B|nr:phage head closure protein [Rhodomicrobium lacus]